MKVLLVESPYYELYSSNEDRFFRRYFPLGLGYIAAFLQRENFDVELLIQQQGCVFQDQIKGRIASFKPDIVGISSMTPSYPSALQIAGIVKSLADVPVVIGGPHATACGSDVLSDCPDIDFAVVGEGELTFLELCRNLRSPERVQGLIWRRDGLVCSNSARQPIADIDSIPFPARDLAELSCFSIHSHMGPEGRRSATLITSRGCPSQCIFCGSRAIMGRGYRMHSPEYVLKELTLLVKKFGIEFVVIQDDTFTVNSERLKKICTMIIEGGLKIEWNCFSRAIDIKPELAGIMRRAGCRIINFGVESGSQAIFSSIKKGGNLDAVKSAVSACNAAGIRTIASFIVGLPGETLDTYRSTIEFAKKLKPAFAVFNPLVPFPGTEIWRKDFRPATPEGWKDFLTTGVPPVSVTEGFTGKQIKRLADAAMLKFYVRPTQLLRVLREVFSLSELREYVRGGYAKLLGFLR